LSAVCQRTDRPADTVDDTVDCSTTPIRWGLVDRWSQVPSRPASSRRSPPRTRRSSKMISQGSEKAIPGDCCWRAPASECAVETTGNCTSVTGRCHDHGNERDERLLRHCPPLEPPSDWATTTTSCPPPITDGLRSVYSSKPAASSSAGRSTGRRRGERRRAVRRHSSRTTQRRQRPVPARTSSPCNSTTDVHGGGAPQGKVAERARSHLQRPLPRDRASGHWV
jgi:hypothetical protein